MQVKKYDWYIKCHPNFVDYFDNTLSVVKNDKIKYLNKVFKSFDIS